MVKPRAVSLMGPTACGKSDLAVAMCERHPFEIVSVDSALVYRDMDIGTAKPSREVLAAVPHHLIDIRDPADTWSAADFRAAALAVMDEILARGKIPLLVGGTMLYFKALISGLAVLPAADPAVRREIEAFARRQGWPAVHARLAGVDPRAAARIHPNDPQRLQRALEVYELTGRPMTALQQAGSLACPWDFCQIAVMPAARAELHDRIQQRFQRMLAEGLVAEVARLRERDDLGPQSPSMKAVGYRQVWNYLDGDGDFDTMVARAVAATRQLAKRQLTWLRRWQDIQVIERAELLPALKILTSGSILS